jgi:Zn-dependent membrane protease YugP
MRRELQRASVRRLAVLSHDVGYAVNHVAYMTLDPLRGRMHGLAYDLVAVPVSLEFKFEAIRKGAVVDAVHRLVPVAVG